MLIAFLVELNTIAEVASFEKGVRTEAKGLLELFSSLKYRDAM